MTGGFLQKLKVEIGRQDAMTLRGRPTRSFCFRIIQELTLETAPLGIFLRASSCPSWKS